MKVGILSDTHDQVARTATAVALLVDAGAEALIHCGDITVPQVVYEVTGPPSYFVFGNCDEDLDGLRRAIATVGGSCLEYGGVITLGERKIAVTHGHLEREFHRLEDLGPDFLLSGHTHCLSRFPSRTDPMDQPRCPAPREAPDRGLAGSRIGPTERDQRFRIRTRSHERMSRSSDFAGRSWANILPGSDSIHGSQPTPK